MTEEIQSIEAQIAEAEAHKAKLAAQLEAKRTEQRKEFVFRIRDEAGSLGMTTQDLIEALGGKRADSSKPRNGRKPRQARVLISDPSKVYLGGALPVWLKDAMFSSGYNPQDKERRRHFIDEHMQAA